MRINEIISLLPLATSGRNWFFWGLLIVVGGGACLFFIVFPLLVFIAALFENLHVPTFRVEPPEKIPRSPALDSAMQFGFTLVGHFTSRDSRVSSRLLSFLLSSDGLILAKIIHNRALRQIDISSRYADKRWLVTRSMSGASDLSGLEIADTLMDAPFEVLLHEHKSRMAAMNHPPIPFLPDTVINDITEHHREGAEQMIRYGFARSTSEDGSSFKYTFKGASETLRRFYKGLGQLRDRVQRTTTVRQQLEWGVREDSGQFLVSDAPPAPTVVDLPGTPVQPALKAPDRPS